MISLLIKTSQDHIDSKDSKDNDNTALHKAVIARQIYTIKKLIAANCAQQKLNSKQEYPITIALSTKDNHDIIQLFYKNNPYPYIQLRKSDAQLIEDNGYSKLDLFRN